MPWSAPSRATSDLPDLARIAGRPGSPLILLAANSAWNISNYRLGLVKALQSAGFDVAVAVPADGDAQKLQCAGVAVHRIGMQPRGTSPVADARLYREYRNLLRRLRPAAVLGFTIKPNARPRLRIQAEQLVAEFCLQQLTNAFETGPGRRALHRFCTSSGQLTSGTEL